MRLIELICGECRKAFLHPEYLVKYREKNGRRIFCSRKCANRGHAKLMVVKNPSMRKDVAQKISEGVKRWHHRVGVKEYIGKCISNGKRKKHPLIRKNCQNCSNELLLNYAQRDKKFCNLSCRTIYKNKTDNPTWNKNVVDKISERMRMDIASGKRQHINSIISKKKEMRKSTEKPVYKMLLSLGLNPYFNKNIGRYWVDFFLEPT